jgi:hypothetical protein
MLIIVLCLLTQNLIQHINFTPNITQSSMVCCSLPFVEDSSLIAFTALPCDKNGKFLPEHTRPPPLDAPDATEDNVYQPFEDRLAFDWAYYHFAEFQSSEREINKGLDLWLAASLKAGNDAPLPWSSAEEMYETINAIQEGDAPFETIRFKYAGPIHPNPPAWMTETYELCMRNSRTLLHH